MSEWEAMSREQLLDVVVGQAARIEAQAARIEAQAARAVEQDARIEVLVAQVAELTRRLGQNSGNSSLPPSSDRFDRPQRQRRAPSTRRPGKQPGAPGSTLEMVAEADEVVEHVPTRCSGCGGGLGDAADVGVVIRQVTDVPVVRPRVTEHRLHRLLCGCGHLTAAQAPAGVDAPASYGPNLRALAAYLVVFQHVPVERAALAIADLTGARVSTGWVSAQVARASEHLGEVSELVKTLVAAAAVIGVDETTVSIAGKKQWLHVARTDLLTAYHLHTSRGRVAVDEFAVLPGYTGTVVHDALSVYDGPRYATARHGLCAAHLIRELTAVAEANPEQTWPLQARSALADLIHLAHAAREQGQRSIRAEDAAEQLLLFRHGVLVALAEHPRAPGRKQSKARNLLERLRDREEQILRFTTDLAVPATNNGSERDLRPVKTQIKISGCHRSATGAKACYASADTSPPSANTATTS